ncbi:MULTISPECIES: CPBP family intramembrane glutamic endopeptidase [Haloferax]|uniref:CPBP family intramembrane metalloprotease n=1 Tax=Haloferax marinum TaxID=2666143 RepID=A0A6A8GA50_9EURY|nr:MULTISPECIES: type II CAAX endopeptidase family protein [Haloferax]KAB1198834.1 CPBP family intramembrane metalloprotease [Haloferax sp. CBA1150]MRW97954.1 CPBP family intramembrane metalloprotease [Haloferax marinum]
MNDAETSHPSPTIRFEGGLVPPVVFFVATMAVTTVAVLFAERFVGVGPMSPVERILYFAVAYGAIGLIALGALYREELRPSDVGLSLQNVVPGVLLVVAIWGGANLLGAATTSETVVFSLPPTVTAVTWATLVVSQLAFVGPIEELAFRGYFQNKFVALFGGGSNRVRKAAGVLVVTVIFALWHIPQRLVIQGLSVSELVPSVTVLFVIGLFFAILYELTRNLVFTGVLHGTFNTQLVVTFTESGAPVTEVMTFVWPLVILAALGYRRWAGVARRGDFSTQSGPSVVGPREDDGVLSGVDD